MVQHILFGSLLSFKTVENPMKLRSTRLQYKPPPIFTTPSSVSAEETREKCHCRDVLKKAPSGI